MVRPDSFISLSPPPSSPVFLAFGLLLPLSLVFDLLVHQGLVRLTFFLAYLPTCSVFSIFPDAALTTLNDPVSTLFASEAENRYIEPVVQLEAFSSALLAALTSSSSSESPTPDELMTEFETTLSTFRTDRLAHQSEDTTTTTFLADPALTGVVFTVRSRFLLALFALSSSSPSSSSSYSTEATDELKGAASSSDATVVDRARLDRAFAQVFEVLGN